MNISGYYDSRTTPRPAPPTHPPCCVCQAPTATYIGGMPYCLRHASAFIATVRVDSLHRTTSTESPT